MKRCVWSPMAVTAVLLDECSFSRGQGHVWCLLRSDASVISGIFCSNTHRLQCDRRHGPSLSRDNDPVLILTAPLSGTHARFPKKQDLWPKHDDQYLAFTQKIIISEAKKPVVREHTLNMTLDSRENHQSEDLCFRSRRASPVGFAGVYFRWRCTVGDHRRHGLVCWHFLTANNEPLV